MTTFKAGDFVWWPTKGYGYKGRIPAVVHRMSQTGKRVYIKFQNASKWAGPIGDTYRYVPPERLELRS